MVGRITKLTPDVQKRIITALEAGNYFETACEAAGISASTGHEWMARGRGTSNTRPQTELYAQFAEAVERASSKAEIDNLNLINKAARDGTWQAAAWWLERRFPNRWGRTRVELTGADGGAIQHLDVTKLSDDELRALVESKGSG